MRDVSGGVCKLQVKLGRRDGFMTAAWLMAYC